MALSFQANYSLGFCKISKRRRLFTDKFSSRNRFTFSPWIRFRLCSNKFFRVSNNICLTEGMTRKKEINNTSVACIYSQEWRHSKNIFLLLPGKKSGRYVRKTRAASAWEREAREKNTRAASARQVHNKSRSCKTLKYDPLQNFFTSLSYRSPLTTWLKRKSTLNQTS